MANTNSTRMSFFDLGIPGLTDQILFICGAGLAAAWRDLVMELDRPLVYRKENGVVVQFRGVRRLKRLLLRASVRFSGSVCAAIMLEQLVIVAAQHIYGGDCMPCVKLAWLLGGFGGWRVIDGMEVAMNSHIADFRSRRERQQKRVQSK